jgi:MoxR-like ATPase
MKEVIGLPKLVNGVYTVTDATTADDITHMFRDDMIKLAVENSQILKFNPETGRGKRVDNDSVANDLITETRQSTVDMTDPVLQFINNASSIKPDTLEMSDIKWKYLIRSVVRGKNIMMCGPAGCGKTMAAQALPEATDRPFFYFNLGATQDPRSTLIGNTHFKDGATVFDKSSFVKAIETENAVILLDELSRAHPEAWNILMTVLDEKQRYLRLDEDVDSPVIQVASGVSFIATANIGTEYTSTRTLDRALMDRFEIIEVDILNKEREAALLAKKFPKLGSEQIASVADIAGISRHEWREEEGKLSTMMSTRMSVRVCELLEDGFTLEEAAQVAIFPFFDASGGVDSERTFIKQVVQKHLATAEQDIFNTQGVDKELSL